MLLLLLKNHIRIYISFTDGVLIWQKEHTLLYQGDIALNKSEHIAKLDNGTLRVTLTSDNDFGNYGCQYLVSNSQHASVNHTIVKPSPPQITSLLPENNQTIVSKLKTVFKLFSQCNYNMKFNFEF